MSTKRRSSIVDPPEDVRLEINASRVNLLSNAGDHCDSSYGDEEIGEKPKNMRKKTLFTIMAILLTELCERMTYFSIASSLVLFSQTKLKFQNDNVGVQIAYVFTGIVYFIPLIGGFIADTMIGRFNTIFGSSLIYVVGLVSLLFASLPVHEMDTFKLEPDPKKALFFIGLAFIAIGTGGIKSNVSPFGAQQLQHLHESVLQSFFNWFYWFINVGGLIAYLGISSLQQNVSFFYGYMVPVLSMLLALLIFISPRNLYIHDEPGENAIKTFVLVHISAFKSWRVRRKILPRHDNETFLDFARTSHGGEFSDQEVSNSKSVIRIVPIFACLIIFWTIFQQMQGNYFLQGERLNLMVGGYPLPVASLSSLDSIIILIATPIFDKIVYPMLDKLCHFKPRMLQRMGFGMMLAAVSVIVAGILEIERKQDMANGNFFNQKVSEKYYNASSISVAAQIPQFLIIGMSEVFTCITMLEFAFSEAPKALKGVMMGILLVTNGLGSFLGAALISIVNALTSPQWLPDDINNGHLEYFFFLLAGMMFVNVCIFIILSLRYTYAKDTPPPEEQIAYYDRKTTVE